MRNAAAAFDGLKFEIRRAQKIQKILKFMVSVFLGSVPFNLIVFTNHR